ncbi:MAG: HAD family hydrolase [Pseudobacteriovorax sp.]|nr:HAD family hydrolase [Pseudobacteriovorax sp.]
MPNMFDKKTLLLDLDGTLLMSRWPGFAICFSLYFVFKAFRYASPYSSFRTFISLRDSLLKNHGGQSNAVMIAQFIASEWDVSEQEARRFYDEVCYEVFHRFSFFFKPADHLDEFLSWVSKHYKLVLATNPVWPKKVAELRVSWLSRSYDFFDFISHGENMTTTKPSVAYYQEILKQTHMEASDALMVGDDIVKDTPATELGIPVFLIGSSMSPLACTVSNLKDLKGVLAHDT